MSRIDAGNEGSAYPYYGGWRVAQLHSVVHCAMLTPASHVAPNSNTGCLPTISSHGIKGMHLSVLAEVRDIGDAPDIRVPPDMVTRECNTVSAVLMSSV
jgi:hypothetical protein